MSNARSCNRFVKKKRRRYRCLGIIGTHVFQVRQFLSRSRAKLSVEKAPGIRVCVCPVVTYYNVTVGFNASRYRHNTYRGAAANHRTASPRRPAPRRSTTTNKPPFCLPSHLAERFFFYFVLFFFFYFVFAFTHVNIDLSPNRYMPIHLGSLPRILQPSDDMFVSRPSRHRVDVASRRLLCECHRAKVSKKAIRQCHIFLFFFFSTIEYLFFFVFFHYSQSTFIEPESMPGVYTLVWNHINAHIIQ